MNTKAPYLSYAMTMVLAIAGNVIASLLFIFVFKEPSPVPVFAFFTLINLLCMSAFALLPRSAKHIAQKISKIVVGGALLFFAVAGRQNFQIEGFFLTAFAGVFAGVTVHFLMAKILFPVIYGRTWCGWNCWTTLVLDFLPYKKGTPWKKNLSAVRFIHFGLSVAVCITLVYGFDYLAHYLKGYDKASGMGNALILHWFVAGNLLYYVSGLVLAVACKDNHAFCKYLCPVSIFLKLSNFLALSRIKGKSKKCDECGNCIEECPASIDIPSFITKEKRVLSTECQMCLRCVAACPNAALFASAGIDFGVAGGYKTS